jgi:DNA-binding transcriptional ArsR family regulator
MHRRAASCRDTFILSSPVCAAFVRNIGPTLILLGRGDIAAVASRLPQERSGVARHLHQLAAAEIVTAEKEGRHVFYQIDAEAVAERLEGILAITRLLASAMGPGAKVA